MEGKTILLILVFLAILINYLKREGFTSEGKLTEYLNTWSVTNNEIRNIFETTGDKIRIKKPIVETSNVRADNDLVAPHIYGNKFVLGKKVYAEDGIKIGFSGTPEKQQDNWQGVIHKAGDGMDISGFGNPRKVRIYDELCIKDTCINEDHLKMLKGEKDIRIRSNNNDFLRRFDGKGVFWNQGDFDANKNNMKDESKFKIQSV